MRPSKRPLLLQAAGAVVLRDGAVALTLDAVAREAGVGSSPAGSRPTWPG